MKVSKFSEQQIGLIQLFDARALNGFRCGRGS
jgi:hypothetical protein